MVHNTATKAAESFEAETGFDVEDILVDSIIGLTRVQRGRMNSQTIVSFCDVRYKAVIKHVLTCWLNQ